MCIDIYSEWTCNFPKIFTHPLPRFETNFLFGPVFIYRSNSDHTGGFSLLLFHGESLIKATYTKISINNIRFSRPFWRHYYSIDSVGISGFIVKIINQRRFFFQRRATCYIWRSKYIVSSFSESRFLKINFLGGLKSY